MRAEFTKAIFEGDARLAARINGGDIGGSGSVVARTELPVARSNGQYTFPPR